MKLKELFSQVIDYCVDKNQPLNTRNIIDIAVREFSDEIIINKFDNHALYYQSRWHISKLKKAKNLS